MKTNSFLLLGFARKTRFLIVPPGLSFKLFFPLFMLLSTLTVEELLSTITRKFPFYSITGLGAAFSGAARDIGKVAKALAYQPFEVYLTPVSIGFS